MRHNLYQNVGRQQLTVTYRDVHKFLIEFNRIQLKQMERTETYKIPQAQLDELYEKMCIPVGFEFTQTKEALYFIANKFYKAFKYSCLDLHLKNRKPLPIDLDALIERMCTKDQGGMCYEHDLLIYYILKHVGFEVSFIEVDHSTLQRLWNPKVVSSHSFVFVELNGASYLLDPGLGFRGYRYPIEFDPSKDLNEVYLSKYEGYRIEAEDDFYVLSSNYPTDDGQFVLYYTFQNPIIKRDLAYIQMVYERLFTTEAMIPARDSRLFTAKRFEEGVLLTMFIKDADEFVAFRKEFKLGNLVEKHFYKNYEEFREDTLKLIGIQFPSREEVIAKVYE